MDDIIEQSELEYIVGYKSPKRIVNWLETNNIPYLISATGKPLVHRNALAYRMGAPTDIKPIENVKLDFSNKKGFKSQ